MDALPFVMGLKLKVPIQAYKDVVIFSLFFCSAIFQGTRMARRHAKWQERTYSTKLCSVFIALCIERQERCTWYPWIFVIVTSPYFCDCF